MAVDPMTESFNRARRQLEAARERQRQRDAASPTPDVGTTASDGGSPPPGPRGGNGGGNGGGGNGGGGGINLSPFEFGGGNRGTFSSTPNTFNRSGSLVGNNAGGSGGSPGGPQTLEQFKALPLEDRQRLLGSGEWLFGAGNLIEKRDPTMPLITLDDGRQVQTFDPTVHIKRGAVGLEEANRLLTELRNSGRFNENRLITLGMNAGLGNPHPNEYRDRTTFGPWQYTDGVQSGRQVFRPQEYWDANKAWSDAGFGYGQAEIDFDPVTGARRSTRESPFGGQQTIMDAGRLGGFDAPRLMLNDAQGNYAGFTYDQFAPAAGQPSVALGSSPWQGAEVGSYASPEGGFTSEQYRTSAEDIQRWKDAGVPPEQIVDHIMTYYFPGNPGARNAVMALVMGQGRA